MKKRVQRWWTEQNKHICWDSLAICKWNRLNNNSGEMCDPSVNDMCSYSSGAVVMIYRYVLTYLVDVRNIAAFMILFIGITQSKHTHTPYARTFGVRRFDYQNMQCESYNQSWNWKKRVFSLGAVVFVPFWFGEWRLLCTRSTLYSIYLSLYYYIVVVVRFFLAFVGLLFIYRNDIYSRAEEKK